MTTGKIMDSYKKKNLYELMLTIRLFEESLFTLYNKGLISGTIHTCIGQEAIAAGVIDQTNKEDIIFSNHRCHGHYIAKTKDIIGLLAEIMGKEGAICKGRGGSQHIHAENFYSNGVQGNMFPVAAGISLAQKIKSENAISIIFIGDGTFGEGIIYETLNILSLWEIPLLIVVENNQYAQSTPISKNFSGNFRDRAKAFEINYGEMDTNDVTKIHHRFNDIIKVMRESKSPHLEVINTYRLAPHSKGDDDRPEHEIKQWRKKDPLLITKNQLKQKDEKIIFDRVSSKISHTIDELISRPNLIES